MMTLKNAFLKKLFITTITLVFSISTIQAQNKDRFLYVNFGGGGLSFSSMSQNYENLLGNFWGPIAYDELGGYYTISPADKNFFAGNVNFGLGYYPLSWLGIHSGIAFTFKGTKVELLAIGNETLSAENEIATFDIPLNVRFRYPSQIFSPYVDIGINYSHFYEATESLFYQYSNGNTEDLESKTWESVNLFDNQNGQYYNRNDVSLVAGFGIHASFVFVEYKFNYGLINFAKTLESRIYTHSFNIGFDYYFKLRSKQ